VDRDIEQTVDTISTRCARGCCATQAEHYRSLHVASPGRKQMRKVTTDVHDHHKVDVTERWDGQDVTVKPDPIKIKAEELRRDK
jgi:hypothetical protein